MFLCPFCLERGRAVSLVTEIEAPGDDPARTIVTDVQGGCEHARQFGEIDGQTLVQMWRVIEAALDAASNPMARNGKDANILRCAKCRRPIAADEPRIRASEASSYHLTCYAEDAARRQPGGRSRR